MTYYFKIRKLAGKPHLLKTDVKSLASDLCKLTNSIFEEECTAIYHATAVSGETIYKVYPSEEYLFIKQISEEEYLSELS